MLKNIILFGIVSVLLLNACIKDDSTAPVKEISNITVKTSSDTITMDFGYALIYEPVVEQTQPDLELTYEWSYQGFVKTSVGGTVRDALQHISNEKILQHSFKNLGEYRLRLKVSNKHGSTFKYFTLFVKAAFDQGIFVLSSNEQKKGRVSFMRPLSREEINAGKEETFYTSAFTTVNPEFALNDPTDVEKIGPDIFIASKADQLIYRIDAQTFELYNITDFKTDFPWMKPIGIFSKDRSITNYIVLSESGGFNRVNYKSDIAYEGNVYFEEHVAMDKMYVKISGAPKPPSVSVTSMRNHSFFLNYASSTLFYIYDLSNSYSFEQTYPDHDLINVVMDENTMSCLIARSKADPEEIIITRGYAGNKGPLTSPWVYTYKANNITLTRASKMQNNTTYNSIFYTNGNKLYRWYNWNAMPVLPETPVLSLPVGTEITCFDFSADGRQIYVGVHNPSATALKGSVYVYDADAIDPATNELKVVKKYEGIADKPIKVFWKNNRK